MNYVTGSLIKQNSWGDNTTEVPAGLIRSISIVTTKKAPIILTNLKITEGVFSITFSQSGKPVAFGSTTDEGSVLFLDTRDGCLSGVLELGLFKNIDLDLELHVPINKSAILIVPETSPDYFKISVTQDGVTETEYLHEDYELTVDPRLSCNYLEEEKTIIVSLSEENSRGLKSIFIETQPEIDRLLSINHVKPSPDGVIYVNLSNITADLVFTKSEKIPAVTIYSDVSPCDTEDVIDNYISPALARTFSYMPLDDAYNKQEDGSYTRNTKENLIVYNSLDPKYDIETI